MKTILVLLVCFICLICAPLLKANPLENPGFENSTNGWKIREGDAISSVVPEAAHSGTAGLRINDQSDKFGANVMSERFPIALGQKASLKFWCRTKDERFVVVALVYFSGDQKWMAANAKLAICVVKDISGEWHENVFEVPTPEDAAAVAVRIYTWGPSKGSADLDDFDLEIK